MSIDKSNIKIGTAHELGCRFDDALESINKDLYRLEGASTAYKHTVQTISELISAVEREYSEGKMNEGTFNSVKKYFEKAHAVLRQQTSQAENNRCVQLGKIQAMQSAVLITKNLIDEEEMKLQRAKEDERSTGEHPGPTVKERRSQRETNKKKK